MEIYPKLIPLQLPEYELLLEKNAHYAYQQIAHPSSQQYSSHQTTICFIAKNNDRYNLLTLNCIKNLFDTPNTWPFSLIIICCSEQLTAIRKIEEWINHNHNGQRSIRFFTTSEQCVDPTLRNISIVQTKTPYLLFLEGGDSIYPSYLTKGIAILNNNPDAAIVYPLTQLTSDDTDKTLLGSISWSKISIRQRNGVTPVGLYRISTLLNIGGYSTAQSICSYFPNEQELWLRLEEKGYKGIKLPEVLACCNTSSSLCYMLDTETPKIEGKIEFVHANYITGWAINNQQPSNSISVRLRIDGKDTDSESLACLESPTLEILIENQPIPCCFNLRIPDQFLDGEVHLYEVLDSDQKVIDQLDGHRFSLRIHIDILTSDRLTGWVIDSYKDLPIELDVYTDSIKARSLTADIYRQDVENGKRCGFDIHLDSSLLNKKIDLTLKNSQYSLIGAAHHITAPGGTIVALQKVSQLVASDSQSILSVVEKKWLLNHFFPSLIRESQSSLRLGENVNFKFSLVQKISSTDTDNRELPCESTVDIVIPVYKNFRITKHCIEAALSARNTTESRLIIVNDDSPESSIRCYLDNIKDFPRITLVTNTKNQGFVHSANTGMMASKHHDIILLNSDAIVNDYWIDRLKIAAYKASNIASATPLSNHASIFSYPRICKEVENLPDDISGAILSQIAYQLHHSSIVDVPTMHGFCCFIKRQAIADVGFFDAEKWGKGYGEEVEWSQKAASQGWRHVAVPGVFIEHRGSQSFSKDKSTALKNALSQLAWDYPEFDDIVQNFIHRDPLAEYRRKLDIERLKRTNDGYILFISHNLGGGTQYHIEDLSQHLLKEGIQSILLYPNEENWMVLSSITSKMINPEQIVSRLSSIDIEAKYRCNYPEDLSALLSDLREINIFHIHIHGILDFKFSDFIWNLAQNLNIDYDVTLHDYYTICPRVNLVNQQGQYCGEPEPNQCNQCIKRNGTYKNQNLQVFYNKLGSIEAWRNTFYLRLKKARRVYVPSYDTRERIARYFPLENVFVKPHPEAYHLSKSQKHLSRKVKMSQRKKTSEKFTIAIIGAISRIKGYNILHETASYVLKHNVPLKFIVFGYTENDATFKHLPNVFITGQYRNHIELSQLLEKYPCDVAAFLSCWPETYCYTLSEALQLGLAPLAFKIGAFTERLNPIRVKTLLPLDEITPKSLTAEFITLAKRYRSDDRQLPEEIEEHLYHSILHDYYDLNDSCCYLIEKHHKLSTSSM